MNVGKLMNVIIDDCSITDYDLASKFDSFIHELDCKYKEKYNIQKKIIETQKDISNLKWYEYSRKQFLKKMLYYLEIQLSNIEIKTMEIKSYYDLIVKE